MIAIKLDALRADLAVQSRAGLDSFAVDEYAEAMRAGDVFPPVIAFGPDADGLHWLADGFHRHAAAGQAGRGELAVDLRPGGRRDAVLYAVGANMSHGLRRTNADKRRAVGILLADVEWSRWSDREIARRAGVSHTLAATLRAELSGNGCQMDERQVHRGGSTYSMSLAKRGDSAVVPEARRLLAETDVAGDRRQVARLARREPEVQVRAAELIAGGEARNVEHALRTIRYDGKAEASLGELEAGRWPVIYADPPWRFDSGDGLRGIAAEHYRCMSTEDICALPVGEHATGDAVLFLWSTYTHLRDAFAVVDAWGFDYCAQFVWIKNTMGIGHYVRGRHEPLLIATRGSFLPRFAPPSVIEAPRGRHSEKPAEVRELIERMYPDVQYLELFARPRDRRESWTFWGNEIMTGAEGSS